MNDTNETGGRATRLYTQACDALNRHEDPFSEAWATRMRMDYDDRIMLMDMVNARLAYADRFVKEGKEPR